jgi:hypothetical protein
VWLKGSALVCVDKVNTLKVLEELRSQDSEIA